MHPAQIGSLAAAIGALGHLGAPADVLLRQFFRANPHMGQRDRAFVAEGVFTWLRRRRSLEARAGTVEPRKLALATALALHPASVREVAAGLGATDVAWLSAYKSRLADALPDAVAADVPDWLWTRLGDAYGTDGRAALARAWQQPAPLDLRVNPMKATRDEALAALRKDGHDANGTPWSPLGIRIHGHPSLAQHPWLVDGRLEVQDEGSQLIGYAVAPRRGEMVADFCAGAGGKTLLLGALMRSTGRLYAFDVVDKRLAKLKPRLARSGLSNVHPQLLASERDAKVKRLAGKFDRVLVDAPCTGLGTLRRNPDLKWRQTEADLAELTAKQAAILAAAATLVKPGGRLVYATCSVLPDENDAIVDAFLSVHPEFSVVPVNGELARAGIALDTGPCLRTSPVTEGCDGFFAAALARGR